MRVAEETREAPSADAYQLAVSALRRVVKMIEDYDNDADALAGDVLEDVRALSTDMLTHIATAGGSSSARQNAIGTV